MVGGSGMAYLCMGYQFSQVIIAAILITFQVSSLILLPSNRHKLSHINPVFLHFDRDGDVCLFILFFRPLQNVLACTLYYADQIEHN